MTIDGSVVVLLPKWSLKFLAADLMFVLDTFVDCLYQLKNNPFPGKNTGVGCHFLL